MKKFNSYYKPNHKLNHNGKSKTHHKPKPLQRKNSDRHKINKQSIRQIEKREKIQLNHKPVLSDNETNDSFLTPNGWVIADFTQDNENPWYSLSDKFSRYKNIYSQSDKKRSLNYLSKMKIDFQERDGNHMTHLMLACAYSFGDNNLTLVKFLLNQGISVNITNIFGKSALDFSLEKQGNIEIIKLLIKNISDKSLLDEALLTWSKTHYLPNIIVADILIKSGASINITDKYGSSLLVNIIGRQLHTHTKYEVFSFDTTNYFTKYVHNFEIKKLRSKNNFYEIIVEIAKFLLLNGIDINLKSLDSPEYIHIDSLISYWHLYHRTEYSLFDYIFCEKKRCNDNPLSKFIEPFFKSLDIQYPEPDYINKQQCYNKLIQLFLIYGCEYDSYLEKFNNNHLEIIKTIEFGKNYFKTINNELENIHTEFVYRPGGIRSNVFKIRWEYHNGLNYSDIKKSNLKIFDYFGIDDEEKFIQIIDSV
ncbi:hypothetical protein QJ850_gp078 [Acanthamoeba polyphaga mimivirus]|uniref:Uncharacterized protein n=1 Tax=Acanthamoeba polyphaga mimivirus Kroon TaxID=3069720 RepID=A0A0G2YC47_9VIRU|nr:hypothetical protein QJ850_gp078 [Acanthamoeba polyphaga mimivirus]AKI80621.1 hypothetical protein [Acanthamoeba polyphaga mimivirus Kroon]